jgi:4'-phosphopantetheinyl transferase
MAPDSDSCEVWWARTADARDELLALLPPAERERHRAFVRQNDRDLYLVAHALTRLLLGSRLDLPPDRIVFSRTCLHCGAEHGKPRLPDSGWETSLSHSGQRVAVAVAVGTPVGVDVERVDRATDIDMLRDSVLDPVEQRVLDSFDGDRRRGFFTYWCRKEALLKATGHGLAIGPARLRVSGPGEPAQLLEWSDDDRPAVRMTDLRPDPDHVACVAILTETGPAVTEHDGSALLRP